jgi:hypothetical protein
LVTKTVPSERKSCCGSVSSKPAKQPAPETFGWNSCDCPTEPGSTLAPVFQPRVCPQTELAWMPLTPRVEFVAPTLSWIGAELEPPTPPPKIVI